MCIRDRVGALKLVLIGNAKTKTVRAYRRENYEFALDSKERSGESSWLVSSSDSKEWKITEGALISPDNERLTRLPGHLAYNFAFNTYFNEKDPATGR